MKKYIIHTLVAVLIGFSATAQIDRSQIPSSGPTPEVNLRDAKEFKLKNRAYRSGSYRHKIPSC